MGSCEEWEIQGRPGTGTLCSSVDWFVLLWTLNDSLLSINFISVDCGHKWCTEKSNGETHSKNRFTSDGAKICEKICYFIMRICKL